EMVSILLEYKAPLDVMDDNGATPLFLAEQMEHAEIVTLLRQAAPADAQGMPGAAPPTRETMRAIAGRIAQGDPTAFDELVNVAGSLYSEVKYEPFPSPQPSHNHALLQLNYDRMEAAFKVLGEEVGKTNEVAFQALKKSLGIRYLQSFAPDALG